MQISVALLVGRSSASRPAGTVEGAHRRDRRDQTPQPPCWLSPHRTAACARLWHRYQQRHRPPGARETLSTRGRNRWPVLAELYRACEGQPVERRSVPLRIDTPAQPLGHGGDGRILEVEEIKSIPSVPVSHPFVERLIGTVRREFLDHVLIWNAIDLERKLDEFRIYYNENRVHQSLSGSTPRERSGEPPPAHAVLDHYAWRHHCRGLFQMPIAA